MRTKLPKSNIINPSVVRIFLIFGNGIYIVILIYVLVCYILKWLKKERKEIKTGI